jgi:hypothetical protein
MPALPAAAVGAEVLERLHELARLREQRGHPRVQRRRRHRLGQEVVDARVARLHHALDLGVRGQHDDRHEGVGAVGRAPHVAGELQPVDRLHPQVADHEVEAARAQHLKRRRAIGRAADRLDAEATQDLRQQVERVLVVVDEQNANALEGLCGHPGGRPLFAAAADARPVRAARVRTASLPEKGLTPA